MSLVSAVEPVAVIGLSCRFPRADSAEVFWALLRDGVDAITEIPPERWDGDLFYDPGLSKGKMNSRRGGFLSDVDKFDPTFFGIDPDKAKFIDPQQRLLLEVAWEALEVAAVSPSRLSGSETGVFVGITFRDYERLSLKDAANWNYGTGFGNLFIMAANRLSYFLGLTGPSMALDTICSSTLVATHLACQSLRSGESEMALVGGVNLMLSPEWSVTISQGRFLAADGRCKSFDASADGYVRGEGCGVLVLKRLSDALASGDNV